MLEPKTPDRRRVVIPDLLLLGIEPHALANDLLRLAGRAPDREGALEAHGEDALGLEFSGSRTESVPFAGGGVGVVGSFEVWRDVAAHVEALHFDGCVLERGSRR